MNEESLNRLKEYAAHFMRLDEIAVLLDIDEESFREEIADKRSEVSKVYRKARAESVFTLRQKIMKLARNGSPQAEILVNRFIEDQLLSEHE